MVFIRIRERTRKSGIYELENIGGDFEGSKASGEGGFDAWNDHTVIFTGDAVHKIYSNTPNGDNQFNSVKMTGNSGPYLLYSAVRAKKILNKSSSKITPIESTDFEPAEKKLIKKILEYKSILAEATAEMAPHKVANYLYELAQDFSRFYENCQVNGCEKESERLTLVRVYLATMTHGLNILGINIPEEM